MDYQRLTIYIIPYNILYIIPFSVDYIIICGYLLGYCTTYIPLFFPNCISRANCLEQSGGVGWFETSQLLLSYPPVLKHGGKAHRILMPKCHGQRHILSSNTKDVWCLHMTRICLVVSIIWFMFHFIYGMSSTNHWRTHIFQRGRYTTNQIHWSYMLTYYINVTN